MKSSDQDDPQVPNKSDKDMKVEIQIKSGDVSQKKMKKSKIHPSKFRFILDFSM